MPDRPRASILSKKPGNVYVFLSQGHVQTVKSEPGKHRQRCYYKVRQGGSGVCLDRRDVSCDLVRFASEESINEPTVYCGKRLGLRRNSLPDTTDSVQY